MIPIHWVGLKYGSLVVHHAFEISTSFRSSLGTTDVFVMDHLVPNINYKHDTKKIKKVYEKKLRKARKSGLYKNYVFYSVSDPKKPISPLSTNDDTKFVDGHYNFCFCLHFHLFTYFSNSNKRYTVFVFIRTC